jgi:hypothetical protein
MSRENKANKNNYSQAGRLTPDDMARERKKQDQVAGQKREQVMGRTRDGERESSRRRSEREESA